MAPRTKDWREPPGIATLGLVGSPGAHSSESYRPRIAPVTFLSVLIHTRSSIRPRALRNAAPVMARLPRPPTTVSDMSRPDTPRWMCRNVRTLPMSPVEGRKRDVISVAEKDAFHCRAGFAAVKSPGSHTPCRYGTGLPPHTFWLLSVKPPDEDE